MMLKYAFLTDNLQWVATLVVTLDDEEIGRGNLEIRRAFQRERMSSTKVCESAANRRVIEP